MKAATKPNIRNTINARFAPPFTYDMYSYLDTIVVPSGYPFFAWNDRIYTTPTTRKENGYWDTTNMETGFFVSDLTVD